jgi:hypothetical protein
VKRAKTGRKPQEYPAGAEQAAEKGLDLIRIPEKHPSGAKARFDFRLLTARLKSCPDTKRQRIDLLIKTPEQD